MDPALLKTLTELDDKVAVVVGTRPGIIMLSPVIAELRRRELPFFIVHTGQHYSSNMDQQLFDDLALPAPDHKFTSLSALRLHGAQTAEMLRLCEEVFLAERPRLVLVGGDANTNLSAALAARKLHIQVGHVEAGERSGDWRMPEEHNRVLIDQLSEYLFATNAKAAGTLRAAAARGRIIVSGNPIVDAIRQHLAAAAQRSDALADLGLERNGYILLTTHREENVDSEVRLRMILQGVRAVQEDLGLPVVFAAHPRTENRIAQFGLTELVASMPGLIRVEAQGYLRFLALAASAGLILTDSGGVQQEACILHVPCVTLRETTEWTETLDCGANMVAGVEPAAIRTAARTMRNVSRGWHHTFGDGHAAARIVDVAEETLDPERRWQGPEMHSLVAEQRPAINT